MVQTPGKKKLTFLVDADMHKQLKIMAVEKDTSITDIVITAIKKTIKKEEKNNK